MIIYWIIAIIIIMSFYNRITRQKNLIKQHTDADADTPMHSVKTTPASQQAISAIVTPVVASLLTGSVMPIAVSLTNSSVMNVLAPISNMSN